MLAGCVVEPAGGHYWYHDSVSLALSKLRFSLRGL
jgi:hypothetical protein